MKELTAGKSKPSRAADTRLQGRWLLLARIGWIAVVVLSFSIFLLGLPPYAAQLHTMCASNTNTGVCSFDGALSPAGVQALHRLGILVDYYIGYTIVVTVFIALVWASIGFLIFWHRSNDWMALLVALFLLTFNPTLVGGPTASLAQSSPHWTLPIECLVFLSTVSELLFFFLFPNGRFAPRWIGWILVPIIVQQGTWIFLPSPLNANAWLVWLNNFILLTFVVSAAVSQIYRYRRVSTPIERQQTKWVLFGIVVFLVAGLVLNAVPSLLSLQTGLFDVADDSLWFILLLPVPLSIGIAMLRFRLWEVDTLINRTLVYAILTTILALVYFGLVVALQSLVHGLTGQVAEYPFAIVCSTLLIAALFQPLRRRIQLIIDRRFYRRKYDAAKSLAAFSTTLQREVDLSQLSEQVMAVVQDTMQPTHVWLWLRPTTSDRKHEAVESNNPLTS